MLFYTECLKITLPTLLTLLLIKITKHILQHAHCLNWLLLEEARLNLFTLECRKVEDKVTISKGIWARVYLDLQGLIIEEDRGKSYFLDQHFTRQMTIQCHIFIIPNEDH